MPRFTLDKFSARKVESQLKKDKFSHMQPTWKGVRKSIPADGSIVLWDPPRNLVDGIAQMLIYELGFTRDRQKTGLPFKSMTSTVEKLKTYSKDNFQGGPLQASESDEQSSEGLTPIP
jgi:hypothetical protein